jgi:hypothetical protein
MKQLYLLLLAIIVFCFPAALQAQIPNSGLENWTYDVDTNYNPVGWETSNSYPMVSVERVPSLCEGSFAMKVKANDVSGFGIPGLASLSFASSERPTSLRLCIRSTVMPGDEIFILFSSYLQDSLVASPDSCTFKLLASLSDTVICMPIKYQNNMTPDSINISIIAGNLLQSQVGTEVIVDGLGFGCATGIDETSLARVALRPAYPNPAADFISVPLSLMESTDVMLVVFDVQGREIRRTTRFLSAGDHLMEIPVIDFAGGVYYFSVKTNGFELPGRFFVSK